MRSDSRTSVWSPGGFLSVQAVEATDDVIHVLLLVRMVSCRAGVVGRGMLPSGRARDSLLGLDVPQNAEGEGKLCDCGAVEDEMHARVECPAYTTTRAKYERDLAFQGRDMRMIMTEAPLLALARFLSEVWETRHVALRRFVLKRTREDDDGPPCNRTKNDLPSMGPPAFADTPAQVLVRNLQTSKLQERFLVCSEPRLFLIISLSELLAAC
ncbi:hypothetical protein VOLCADRAFT_86433 [Volvox carteri f. nagariensis]|uniref:Uncharacterized protein n=1 Tax=Volvox carteri f. nagariensis TaxID=3068 RepID=D8TIS0_VOLCA|nr:uncharacterized protein VOLCADRAFT_86433 [Volvox carteri f. nagariensis]EFJ52936.1 hypothetical protein VOLCADRAFT_86433 [Volvox carteri f. nagariensis]|eukprot:XP_002945941.1 hypothetical protein VOLCADRAFT_86433 [Volvox carteri f. nagariensis]